MKKSKGMKFTKTPPKQDGAYVAIDVDGNYDILLIRDKYVQSSDGKWGTDLKCLVVDGWMFGGLIESY